MDRILIEGLEFDAVIGVYDWEKRIHQRLRLDLELGWDIRPAASADDLAQTLDYAAISERITDFATQHHFELVETFAERIAALVKEEFGVANLRLTLRKPGAVANAQAVGVRIERGEWSGR